MIYVVYALIKNKGCVYVGCTNNIKQRLNQHKTNKDFDSCIILSYHNDKKEALVAERSIIKFLSVFGGKECYNAKYDLLSFKSALIHGLDKDQKSY